MRYFFLFACILGKVLFATESDELMQALKRIDACLFIEDTPSALLLAKRAVHTWPEEKKAWHSYIQALAASQEEELALKNYLTFQEKFISDWDLLEKICWSIVKKGAFSSQYSLQLASLLGAFFTQDAEAVKILQNMIHSSHTFIRMVAAELAGYYGDKRLQEEVLHQFQKETIPIVRVELLKTMGKLKIVSKVEDLEQILKKGKTTLEEKEAAMKALIYMYEEEVPLHKIQLLAQEKRASLRILACRLIAHFSQKEGKELLFPLLRDTRPDVRIEALHAIAFAHLEELTPTDIGKIENLLEDKHPKVVISASWVLFLHNPKKEHLLDRWVFDEVRENRWMAAAAIAAAGERGIFLAQRCLRDSKDEYVRINLALGLAKQRQDLRLVQDILIQALKQEKMKWMWTDAYNPLFRRIVPAKLRYQEGLYFLPELMDQKIRLEIVSLLSFLEDARAEPWLRSFLKNRHKEISKEALMLLLREKSHFASELIEPLLQDEDKEVQLQAAYILASFSQEEKAIQILEETYFQSGYEKKIHILEAMALVGTRENLPFFLKAFQEPFPTLRVIAASALLQAMKR